MIILGIILTLLFGPIGLLFAILIAVVNKGDKK